MPTVSIDTNEIPFFTVTALNVRAAVAAMPRVMTVPCNSCLRGVHIQRNAVLLNRHDATGNAILWRPRWLFLRFIVFQRAQQARSRHGRGSR